MTVSFTQTLLHSLVRAGLPHPEKFRIYYGGACLFLCKITHLPGSPPSPWSVSVKDLSSLPFSLPPSEVTEWIAISSSSKSEVKEKTKPNKEIDPGAPMEFYNQTHILDTSVLSKSPLKCKNLICQHVYIISSITVEVVAGCGDMGLQTPGSLKWEDVGWLEFTPGGIVSDSSAIRLLTLIPDTLSLHWD